MKIGIFDSGLGGLIVARSIRKLMPEYDYVYLGDTKRVPYGNRSQAEVYKFTKEGVNYLFEKENCAIVIVACNTASARALRKLQHEYTPSASSHSPLSRGRRILGVLIPAAEEAGQYDRVGVLATSSAVASKTFIIEIKKINKNAKVFQNPAPMLVPLVEAGDMSATIPYIKKYLKPLLDKNIDTLILGCTHYPILKNQIKIEIKKQSLRNIKIISQDEIIPKKLKDYFSRHPEIQKKLSKKSTAKILVTDITKTVNTLTNKWFGEDIKPKLVSL